MTSDGEPESTGGDGAELTMTATRSKVARRSVDSDGLPSAEFRPLIETTVNVLTWNVWHRFGPWERRHKAILHTIERCQPDIVTLQEVPNSPDDGTLSDKLAAELGMHTHYSPYATTLGAETGLAVLSRWPIADTDSASLPLPPSAEQEWGRSILMAQVAGPRGVIPVFTTHLSFTPEGSAVRTAQLIAAAEFMQRRTSPDFPLILTGDFNADPSCDEIRMITGRTGMPSGMQVMVDAWEAAGDGPGATMSNDNPWARHALELTRRIDYILVGKPYQGGAGHPVAARLEGVEPYQEIVGSDHYAVLAALRY
jgi:endonuclease/exonuclease/phosphatase family metal-dependent hydrolase